MPHRFVSLVADCFLREHDQRGRRATIFVNFLLTFLDILTIPFGLIAMLFVIWSPVWFGIWSRRSRPGSLRSTPSPNTSRSASVFHTPKKRKPNKQTKVTKKSEAKKPKKKKRSQKSEAKKKRKEQQKTQRHKRERNANKVQQKKQPNFCVNFFQGNFRFFAKKKKHELTDFVRRRMRNFPIFTKAHQWPSVCPLFRTSISCSRFSRNSGPFVPHFIFASFCASLARNWLSFGYLQRRELETAPFGCFCWLGAIFSWFIDTAVSFADFGYDLSDSGSDWGLGRSFDETRCVESVGKCN